MKRILGLFFLASFAIFAAIGCQNGPTPTNSADSDVNFPIQAPKYVPNGATLESATLHIYVNRPNSQEIFIHRITSDWDELTVTHNNFGGAFDATPMGSFVADVSGWKTADVTSLVAGWDNDDYMNYGLLLDQDEFNTPRARYFSRDYATNHPYLEVCYEMDGEVVCENFMAIADSYIWEIRPDSNYGTDILLYTGWVAENDFEKQSLIRFEEPDDEPLLGALGDFVWEDLNMDGLQDDGEPGISGVTVNLYDCEDNFLATTMTDADGYYLFEDLMAGDYMVEFIAPDGYFFTMMNVGGDDAIDSDANTQSGMTDCITLGEGEVNLTVDAGLYMEVPQDGCTLTIGYWKNHAGFGPQPDMLSQYLPITLGNGGGESVVVSDAATAVMIFTMGKDNAKNGIHKLMAQLLAAKLNIAAGASDMDIAGYLNEADDFLTDYSAADWDDLDEMMQGYVLDLKDNFDDYNNGYIGPGHCDDFEDDEEEEEEEDDEEDDD